MRLLAVTRKDLLQSTRSLSAWIFMFGVPILVTGIFYVIFGGASSEDQAFELPRTALVVVDEDHGGLPESTSGVFALPSGGEVQADSLGQYLVSALESEAFADLFDVSRAPDAAAALAAVESGEAGVAVLVPYEFTEAVVVGAEPAELTIYQDPTLTLGPAIVSGVVRQLVDGFASANIGVSVTLEIVAESGIPVDAALIQEVVNQVTAEAAGAQAGASLVALEAPPGTESSGGQLSSILGLIMSGMMVFYAFFTGAASLQSILIEEERGTLPRLFSTPTPIPQILAGKFLAALLMLIVQVTVLILFGRLVFGIRWGEPLLVLVAGIGLVIVSVTAGLFLVSFLENPRQAGVVFGGVLTLTGMLGMITVFTSGAPNTPEMVKTASLLVPQGWALRSIQEAMGGSPLSVVAGSVAVSLVWSVFFALIGQWRLSRRFA